MLLRVLPEQVSREWDVIWPGIQASLPYDIPPAGQTKALESFMSGAMQCWFLVKEKDVCALGVTTIFIDPCGRRSLFIYTLLGYKPLQAEDWGDALTSLKKWAKSKGCVEILTHTPMNNSPALRLVQSMGGDTSTIIAKINLNGGV